MLLSPPLASSGRRPAEIGGRRGDLREAPGGETGARIQAVSGQVREMQGSRGVG
jgi:hypothetical protein